MDPWQFDVPEDIDSRIVLTNCCAIPADIHFAAPRGISVFRTFTAGVHCDYARELSEEDGVELRHDQLFPSDRRSRPNIRRHGPALCRKSQPPIYRKLVLFPETSAVHSDAAIQGTKISDDKSTGHTIDDVPCVRCPRWLGEAAEWITRRRLHG